MFCVALVMGEYVFCHFLGVVKTIMEKEHCNEHLFIFVHHTQSVRYNPRFYESFELLDC